jgi:spermidine/putrescine transport system ATP-binding protein
MDEERDAEVTPDKGEPVSADITLRGLTKRFGDQVAVDDLDLEIPRGSFFALLGPSGCGKTTTLRMIGGFEEPTVGTVELGGVDVTGIPPHKRDVNTVFQSYALFPHMTVEKNVAFGLERKKVPKAEIKRRVAETLGLVELGHLAGRKPAQMSGGQQQRVALARALVNHPRALLLDEPLGALDLRLRKQLQLELSRIQRDVGITFVHVTHDQEEAMTMADTIAVMRDGRIDQLGSAAELYDTPRTEFVANFLGSSNLIDAHRTGGDAQMATFEADGAARLAVPMARVDAAGEGPLRIGVRPEKISLKAADAGAPAVNGSNVLLGHVTDASFLGVSTQYVIRTDGGADLQVFAQNAGAGLEQIGPGRRVAAIWNPDHTFVVSKETDHAE